MFSSFLPVETDLLKGSWFKEKYRESQEDNFQTPILDVLRRASNDGDNIRYAYHPL